MRELVVDSSVFVAAFRKQEPHSEKAFRIVKQLEKGALAALIPVSVVLEVVAAIKRRTRSSTLARQISKKIFAFSTVSFIDLTTFRMTRYLELASSLGLAGMDVIVVGVAQEFDLPLATLDQEIIQRAKGIVEIAEIHKF